MSLFDRLGNLVKGKANAAAERVVGGLEQDHVDAVYEAAVDDGKARLAEHRSTAAALVVQRDRRAEELQAAERELAQVAVALKGAVDEGDDDTAVALLAHREELVGRVEALTAELLAVSTQVEQAKEAIRAHEAGVVALGREKTTAVAQKAAAEAAIVIADAISGVSDHPTARALDSVRESVGALERRAHPGWLDEDGESVRGRAEALGKKAKEQDARDQLEALKKQRKGGP